MNSGHTNCEPVSSLGIFAIPVQGGGQGGGVSNVKRKHDPKVKRKLFVGPRKKKKIKNIDENFNKKSKVNT